MNLRRALFVAAIALASTAVPAAAQFEQAQEPPCIKTFSALRDKAETRAKAVMAAQKRKAPLSEACKLLISFAEAQAKMMKFAKENATWCGMPPKFVEQISLVYGNIAKARTRVCKLAAAPPRPAGPTLSDALSAPPPSASNIKTGRGTFDTLTGSPIGK